MMTLTRFRQTAPQTVLLVFVLMGLAGCGNKEAGRAVAPQPNAPQADPSSLLAPQDNLAAPSQGARAIASSQAANAPASNLNDGSAEWWGAAEGKDDVYAAIVLPAPRAVKEIRLQLFSPDQPPRPHLRDIRIVCADSDGAGRPEWRVVRGRLSQAVGYSEKLTVPPLGDGSVVMAEIDPGDPNAGLHKIWGIACFSATKGDLRNYLTVGTGVYVREIQMR